MNLYRIARVRWGCGVFKSAPGSKMTVVVVIAVLCVSVLIFPLRFCYAQRQNPILKTDFLQSERNSGYELILALCMPAFPH